MNHLSYVNVFYFYDVYCYYYYYFCHDCDCLKMMPIPSPMKLTIYYHFHQTCQQTQSHRDYDKILTLFLTMLSPFYSNNNILSKF